MPLQTNMFPWKRLEQQQKSCVFSWSVPGGYQWDKFIVNALQRVVGYLRDSNEVSAGAEESPLLATVTREQPVKSQ
jgi:hypothetical protein